MNLNIVKDRTKSIFRCPTERVKKSKWKLETKNTENKFNDNSLNKNDEDADSIDLDKELLGISSSQWKLDKHSYKQSQSKCNEDMYLSPGNGKKSSPYSRKITENTDITKADSINKLSESSSKLVSRIKVKGFELESLPSSQLFNTKSDEQEEIKIK